MKFVTDFSLLSAPVRARAGWHPGWLFRGGSPGAWYDLSDLSALFQDAAGTIPVAADGDPVGLVLDKSGNAHHATQATPAARPTWRTDGDLTWIEFDGVDDHMVIPAISYAAPMSVCLGLQRFERVTWGAFRSPRALPPYVAAGASTPSDAGSITNTAGGTDRIDGAASSYARDDLYEALQTPRVGTAFANTSPHLNLEGTFFCYGQFRPSGKVFGYVEIEDAGLAEIVRLERWMADRTGVSL
ncbi:hypothetical protein [Maritimibacter sp. HL-12]|uniref:hypothetical protein n=1 Tax=Maritimibacter sp. HL-12 TaxID=1162418 RepID=UPI000A0F1D8C|nr:hypothetical protein [Maritimibacter sp. HL-12]SMH54609.1 hypothetical protein SAMN05661107_2976 [Maritimibacter sp. HL-12]